MRASKKFTVQYDEAGYSQPSGMGESVDDFFAAKCDVHLERMEDSNYWMGVYLADGTKLRFFIGHKNPLARVNAYFEVEG